MKERIEGLVHRLLRPWGVDLKRYDALVDPHLRRQKLLEHYAIDWVLDAGANVGQYAQRLRAEGYRGHILSLEPGSRAFEELENRSRGDAFWEVRRFALGVEAGKATLLLSGNSVSSSLMTLTPKGAGVAGSEVTGREEVATLALDELMDAEPAGSRRLLKFDVQGMEGAVLRAGPRAVASCTLLELELAPAALFEGQTTALELMNELAGRGLDLVSVTPNTLDRDSGRLLEFDAIFARRDHAPS